VKIKLLTVENSVRGYSYVTDKFVFDSFTAYYASENAFGKFPLFLLGK